MTNSSRGGRPRTFSPASLPSKAWRARHRCVAHRATTQHSSQLRDSRRFSGGALNDRAAGGCAGGPAVPPPVRPSAGPGGGILRGATLACGVRAVGADLGPKSARSRPHRRFSPFSAKTPQRGKIAGDRAACGPGSILSGTELPAVWAVACRRRLARSASRTQPECMNIRGVHLMGRLNVALSAPQRLPGPMYKRLPDV